MFQDKSKWIQSISRFSREFRFDEMLLNPKPNTPSVAFKCTESTDNMMTCAIRNCILHCVLSYSQTMLTDHIVLTVLEFYTFDCVCCLL